MFIITVPSFFATFEARIRLFRSLIFRSSYSCILSKILVSAGLYVNFSFIWSAILLNSFFKISSKDLIVYYLSSLFEWSIYFKSSNISKVLLIPKMMTFASWDKYSVSRVTIIRFERLGSSVGLIFEVALSKNLWTLWVTRWISSNFIFKL